MPSARNELKGASRILAKLTFAWLCLVSLPTNAQQEALDGLITKLQGSFSKVETASYTYEQEIKLLEFSTVNYAFRQTDKKGVSISFQEEFNLADIDPYAVREETQKDIIYVVLTARNKQKLFKSIKNGKTEPFDDEVKIHASNVDHARVILDIVKQAIPIGEKIHKTEASRVREHGQMARGTCGQGKRWREVGGANAAAAGIPRQFQAAAN